MPKQETKPSLCRLINEVQRVWILNKQQNAHKYSQDNKHTDATSRPETN